MKKFGAYYQVYKSPYATYKCLESFRKLYPTNTIVMVSDNGYDYTEMAKHFNCIYIHSEESLPLLYKIINNVKEGCNDNIQNWIFNLLQRLSNSFAHIKEEYVIWLEDDVSINNIINDELIYDINGFNPNEFKYDMIEKISKNYPNINIDKRYTWSGHGGSIFNKNNILRYIQDIDMINDIGNNWFEYNLSDCLACDFILSLITHLNGGTVGPLNNHLDCYYLDTKIDIQHQYKVYYNIEMPTELKYLFN